jgi:hypothetical protein
MLGRMGAGDGPVFGRAPPIGPTARLHWECIVDSDRCRGPIGCRVRSDGASSPQLRAADEAKCQEGLGIEHSPVRVNRRRRSLLMEIRKESHTDLM